MKSNPNSEEDTLREEIEKIFEEHQICSWWDKFEFTDCRVNITSEIEALFQQKLEESFKKLEFDPDKDYIVVVKKGSLSPEDLYRLLPGDVRGVIVENIKDLKAMETLGGRK